MAVSLIRKTVRNHQYWYLIESRRVHGKPRIVWQRYLGKAEDLARKLQAVRESEVYEFGAVAAVLAVATRLGLEAIVDRYAGKRRQGVSVGRLILLAAINRVVSPKSKAQVGAWYDQTVLRRLWGIPATTFTSQAFWEAMDHLDEAKLQAIETEVARAAIDQFGIMVTALVYDGTNFATYLSAANPSELVRRGYNKQKRNDLRQVSLVLLTTAEDHVPLLHDTYPGNVPDPIEFARIVDKMRQRLDSLAVLGGGSDRITVVFDKGNPSKANFTTFADPTQAAGLSFVSSLVPRRHPDLAYRPLTDFHPVDDERWPGLLAFSTEKKVYGTTRRVVVTYNPVLAEGQWRGISLQQAKLEVGLGTLVERLSSPPGGVGRRRKTSRESAERYIQRLLAANREAGPLLAWQVAEDDTGQVRVSYHWDEAKIAELKNRRLGRTILFTDHMDWDDVSIIAAYRSQGTLEDAFRQMKDPRFVTVTPIFHWTDQKIRVHIAVCVMALLLASLLYREARQAGYDQGFDALMETLAGIRGVVDLPPEGTRERPRIRLSKRTPEQEQLFVSLGLSRFAPASR